MKKLIIRLVVVTVVVAVLAVVGLAMLFNGIVKKGLVAGGSQITKVNFQVGGTRVNPFGGNAKISSLAIGNPEGFKTDSAIKIGTLSMAVKPFSLMSDRVMISSLAVENPEITYEVTAGGINLTKIQENVMAYVPSGPSNRKIQIDDLAITGGKINFSVNIPVLGVKTGTVPLPDIHLQDLGKGTEGLTPGEIASKITVAIAQGAAAAAKDAISKLGGALTDSAKSLGQDTQKNLQNATKGLGDLFKK